MVGAEARTYDRQQCVSFRKTDGTFGGLSNMAPGFPLKVNGVLIRTSEALYQACRFPHLPKVQRLIIDEGSPMTAKMKSKPYRSQSRPDWDAVRVKIMRWCLRVKLAQHWEKFSRLLLATGDQPIVEDSRKDDFWGAKPQDDGTLIGGNVLGRLLMELREQLRHPGVSALSRVEPPTIPNFLLYERPIEVIDDRLGADLSDSPRDLFSASTAPHLAPPAEASAPVSADPTGSPTSHVASTETKQIDSRTSPSVYPKRLIEVDLPIRKISEHARREKSVRHGHLSTLHMWWARRPLAACRAVILSALVPDPADPLCPESFRSVARASLARLRDERGGAPRDLDDSLQLRSALLGFVADFANWDSSLDPVCLRTARDLVAAAHSALGTRGTDRPVVVDPFAGGGAVPLEALRLGAEAFASDLNPVAVLLNRTTLDLIPRGGATLRAEVERAGKTVRDAARSRLAELFPAASDGARPIAYLWARTVRCEGPGCGVEVPLLQSCWLARKSRLLLAFAPAFNDKSRRVDLPIVRIASPGDVPAPTTRRGSVTCPACKYTTPVKSVRVQLRERRGGAADARLTAVVFDKAGETQYREPTPRDIDAVRAASRMVDSIDATLIPNEPTPDNKGHRAVGSPFIYGMTTWRDIFSPRQLVTLSTFAECIREHRGSDPQMDVSIRACLALALGKVADYSSSLSTWRTQRSCVRGTFARQALGFTWDFGEMNPFAESASDFVEACSYVGRVIDHVSRATGGRSGEAQAANAVSHPLPDDSASAVITDPPYYDSVPFGEIADFFYVWLKRVLADDFPEIFSAKLTPKSEQAIVWHPDSEEEAVEYSKKMTAAMTEARRVTEPSGIGVVFFAHKSTRGWEAQLQAMLDAGWVVTGSWPIDTERGGRFNAQGAAALGSSVQLVCRPRESRDGRVIANDVGDWREILNELPRRIHDWLPRLAREGVVGADAIFACIGPALEVFSRHSRVEKASGESVPLREYLEQVWAAVSREALSMIFEGADTAGLEPDARLSAIWLWTLASSSPLAAYAAEDENGNGEDEELSENEDGPATGGPSAADFVLEFDAARKIAQGLGARLEELVHVVEVKGEKARLLPVAERMTHLFGRADGAPTARTAATKKQMALFADLEQAVDGRSWGEAGAPKAGTTTLDRVHQAMLLFGAGRGEALKRFIVEEGVGKQPQFWKLAQSLSALYPSGTDEKRWVDGVLARKKGLGF